MQGTAVSFENNKKGDVILYFYVNKNAVIIGRNQNAWKECNIANMDADGVQLVRRHSGGGAVFHDNGNLNFSFITDEKHYDLNRQMRVILNAVSKLGLKAELSGRNDITVDGKNSRAMRSALQRAIVHITERYW